MSIPFICLGVMLILVVLTKAPVALAMHRQGLGQGKGYDNRTPRAQQAALTGWGARALAAHQNTFEAIIIFTPAVMIATVGGPTAASPHAATLALIHTAARVVYPVLYIVDVHILRSAVWGVGFLSALAMAFLPLFAG